MYLYGIDGSVIFNILNGTYNEQIDLDGAITGSSATNTVTFQSASGTSTGVIITHSATATANNFVLKINIAEHIKIINLSLTAGGTDFARVVYLDNLNGNLEFSGNILTGFILSSPGSYTEQSVVSSNPHFVQLNNSTFQNNIINHGHNGLDLRLSTTDALTSNLKIIGNKISSYFSALFLTTVDAPVITSNTFISIFDSGLFLNACQNDFLIENNKIIGKKGISLSVCNRSGTVAGSVKNNFISARFGGVRISGSKNIEFQFNTINISLSSENPNSSGISLANSGSFDISDINIHNNIINNLIEGRSIEWYDGTNILCDYNNLYTNGTNLARKGSTDYTSLSAWQAPVGSGGSGLDANSYNETITFTSNYDLHIVSTSAPLLGTVISGINEDIDGEIRANPPFIGADEPNGVNVNITLFLEGPYNSTNMNASLTVPVNSPFTTEDPETENTIPFISGNEIVDWVLVQLRHKTTHAVIESQSAFIRKDGSIVDLDGNNPVHFNSPTDDYFIAVKHRNHLSVMSDEAVSLSGAAN